MSIYLSKDGRFTTFAVAALVALRHNDPTGAEKLLSAGLKGVIPHDLEPVAEVLGIDDPNAFRL